MSTARTHRRNAGRGSHRPILPTPTASNYTPISAEWFDASSAVEIEGTDDGFVDPAEFDFDPADYTIEEVKEFVTSNPQTVALVIELEGAGKNRSGLLSWLDQVEGDEQEGGV